jgi:RNA polymerase sigma-70 factor (ECF subfamily)
VIGLAREQRDDERRLREPEVTVRREADRPERRLAARLARGDESALREIERRDGPLLRGYLAQTLKDPGAAEEVQQQVLLELWQRRLQYDPARSSIASWAMMICRSRAIDYLRRNVPEPRDPQDDAIWRETVLAQESVADELAEQWRVAQLVSRLPHEEAELLRLRFQSELSQREIAARTGIPLGTVKMRMVSALGRLREMIEAEDAK